MDEEVKNNDMSMDNHVRLTHCNNLWLLYRTLSENVTMTEEAEKKIYYSLFGFLDME